MGKLSLVVGKSYVTRLGEVVRIASSMATNTQFYLMGYRFVGGLCGQYYTETGLTYLDGSENPGDLVEELQLPKIELIVGASYKTVEGDIVTIARDMRTENGHLGSDRLAIEKGYVFRADNGDSYQPDGRFDLDEKTSLDITEAIEKEYIISYDWNSLTGEDFELIKALHPADALIKFKKSSSGKPTRVYEVKDVTPKD